MLYFHLCGCFGSTLFIEGWNEQNGFKKALSFPAWKEIVHVILKMNHLLSSLEMPVLQSCLCAVDIESWLFSVILCSVMSPAAAHFSHDLLPSEKTCIFCLYTHSDTRLCLVSFPRDSGAWGLNVNLDCKCPQGALRRHSCTLCVQLVISDDLTWVTSSNWNACSKFLQIINLALG